MVQLKLWVKGSASLSPVGDQGGQGNYAMGHCM